MTDASNDQNEQQTGFSDETEDEEMMTDADDDFSNDADDEEMLAYGGTAGERDDFADELTPNDLFGLDPLDVLTLEELAEYLKVSTAAAHRMIKEQKLPGRNIGGQWRFLRDAVANWLRCLEPSVQQQQKTREDYSTSNADASSGESERFTRGPKTPYSSEPGREYRSRQRYPEGGGQQGYRTGQYGGGQYGGGSGRTGRRPFRSSEGGGNAESVYGAEEGGGGTDHGGGERIGGYRGGQRRFGGGPKRRNKRQVFENERGKRMDRRKEGRPPEGSE